jgi:hypothetical protein
MILIDTPWISLTFMVKAIHSSLFHKFNMSFVFLSKVNKGDHSNMFVYMKSRLLQNLFVGL